MGKIGTLKNRIKTVENRHVPAAAVDRIRGRKLSRIRERILLRDNFTCQRCGRVSRALEIDHIVPLHLGGAENDENRQALCAEPCHREKTEREGIQRGKKY